MKRKHKKWVAAASSVIGVLAAFQLLKTDQAVAITAAIAAIAAAWAPGEDK